MNHDCRTTVCPGCGLTLQATGFPPPDRFNASGECWQLFSDLSASAMADPDPAFIHQHAVDAYEAQHAGGRTRNITVVFGLAGLYLALEKGFSGRKVQMAHQQMARIRRDWPPLDPPSRPAAMTVRDVLQVSEGPERDTMIRHWMAEVWKSWEDRQPEVRETTDALLAQGSGNPRH